MIGAGATAIKKMSHYLLFITNLYLLTVSEQKNNHGIFCSKRKCTYKVMGSEFFNSRFRDFPSKLLKFTVYGEFPSCSDLSNLVSFKAKQNF